MVDDENMLEADSSEEEESDDSDVQEVSVDGSG